LKAGVVVKERRARMAVVGRAVGVAKRVRVVAGRRRKEAKSLEAIVAGVVRVGSRRA
jgi:hypothetical protein